MKSVRYAAGAAVAGLAPLAAFAAPGTAHAPAVPPHQAGLAAKTVRLAPLHDGNVCSGQTWISNKTGTTGQSEQIVGYYWAWSNDHKEACVGTVYGSYGRVDTGDGKNPTAFRVRIWNGGTIESSSYGSIHNGPQENGDFREFVGKAVFRSWYPTPVQVCGAWLDGNTVIGTVPCATVN